MLFLSFLSRDYPDEESGDDGGSSDAGDDEGERMFGRGAQRRVRGEDWCGGHCVALCWLHPRWVCLSFPASSAVVMFCGWLMQTRLLLLLLIRNIRSDDDVDPYGSSGESYGHVAYEDALAAEAAWMARR